jgi:hypothetical protein
MTPLCAPTQSVEQLQLRMEAEGLDPAVLTALTALTQGAASDSAVASSPAPALRAPAPVVTTIPVEASRPATKEQTAAPSTAFASTPRGFDAAGGGATASGPVSPVPSPSPAVASKLAPPVPARVPILDEPPPGGGDVRRTRDTHIPTAVYGAKAAPVPVPAPGPAAPAAAVSDPRYTKYQKLHALGQVWTASSINLVM